MSKKVLVIGSGPSGIFTCGALSTDKSIDVKVLVAIYPAGFRAENFDPVLRSGWRGLRTLGPSRLKERIIFSGIKCDH